MSEVGYSPREPKAAGMEVRAGGGADICRQAGDR